jgi:ABC-2 type transport system ATP-binding protein
LSKKPQARAQQKNEEKAKTTAKEKEGEREEEEYTGKYVIEIENLTKYFGQKEEIVKAVDGISFNVPPGIMGYLGPNGAGKTTTIKMLVGAIKPTGGDATIMGHKIGTVAARKLIGYSPEHPRFYDHMTPINYLIFLGELGGLTRHEAEEKAFEILETLELEQAAYRNIVDFSAGMRQKMALAQALIHEPKLLILDEPTANLDPVGRAKILDQIKYLARKKGMTTLISSHILGEIEKVAEYVTIINKGKIVISDTMDAVKELYAGNQYVMRTSQNAKVVDLLQTTDYVETVWIDENGDIKIKAKDEAELKRQIPTILKKTNVTLDAFHRVTVSLEDIFMRVTGLGSFKMVTEKEGEEGEEAEEITWEYIESE